MSRPVTVSKQQIVEAARAVFLEKGFGDATTASIAERAGVSEGSLFNRFKGKVELFLAAMDLPPLDVLDRLPGMVGTGDVRANLRSVGQELMDFVLQLLPKMMMIWSQRNGLRCSNGEESPPAKVLRSLTGYFRAEAEAGRLVAQHPEICARLFMGGIWNYCFMHIISDQAARDRHGFVEQLVEQLWNGMAPPTAVKKKPRRNGRSQ